MPSSVTCRPRSGGSITVSRSDTLTDLIMDSQAKTRPVGSAINVSNNNNLKPIPFPSEFRDCALLNAPLSTVYRDWLSPQAARRIQTASEPEGRSMDQMCSAILQMEQYYTKDIDEYLCDLNVLDVRRREMLYRKWLDNVYNPIRQQVSSELGALDCCLTSHKRRLYDSFLEMVNRRRCVFLGDPQPCDERYHPLIPTAYTGPLNDPLLAQERVRSAEDGAIYRCSTGHRLTRAQIDQLRLPTLPLRPTGRHGIGWPTWQATSVSSIESPVRIVARKSKHSNPNKSAITWKHYYEPVCKELIDAELGLGGLRRLEPPRGEGFSLAWKQEREGHAPRGDHCHLQPQRTVDADCHHHHQQQCTGENQGNGTVSACATTSNTCGNVSVVSQKSGIAEALVTVSANDPVHCL